MEPDIDPNLEPDVGMLGTDLRDELYNADVENGGPGDAGIDAINGNDGEDEEGDDVGDEFVAVDETTASDNQFAQRIRQRAEEEHHEQLRMCPHFNYEYRDTNEFRVELDEWFEYSNNHLFALAKDTFGAEGCAGFRKRPYCDREEYACSVLEELNGKPSSDRVQTILLILAYISQGTFGEVTTVDDHVTQIQLNCKMLWKCGAVPVLYNHIQQCIESVLDQSPDAHIKVEELNLSSTVFYLIVESCRNNEEFVETLSDLNPSILFYLTETIARLRWTVTETFPIRSMLLLFWKCILCLFGGRARLETVKKFVRTQYNLPTTDDPDDIITASPLDYHEFREDLISRYPAYDPPLSKLSDDALNSVGLAKYIEVPRPSHTQAINNSVPPPTVHIATPAPSPPLAPVIGTGQKLRKSMFMTNQSFPFLYPTEDESNGENATTVPQSIVEAGELFSSRIRTTPAMIQLWNERDKFMQHERGWEEPVKSSEPWMTLDTPETRILQRVEKFYVDALPYLSSCVNVILRVMLANVNFSPSQGASYEQGSNLSRTREVNLKSISAILDLLTSWFKASHVLKSEYLCTLLFDTSYYLIVYKFLYLHTPLDKALEIPDLCHLNFFTQCRLLSDAAVHNYGETYNEKILPSPEMARFSSEINSFSSRYFFTTINFIRVLRRMIKGKTQRIIVVAELPSETLKKVLSVHQEDLYKMVLEIFKEQAPYNGRKWKYTNMDLVSAIYLHCKAKLRDDWLSGLDISGEVDDAYPQEIAMRSLTQFYNNRLADTTMGEEDSDVGGLNLHDLSIHSK